MMLESAPRRRVARVALHLGPLQHVSAAAASEQPKEHQHPVMPWEPRLEQLLRPGVLAKFDREKFESDGYWLWAGALTDEGRARMTAELQRLQTMQDYMVRNTRWADGIDWAARGLPPPPPERLTAEWRETRVCGGSEQLSYYPAQGDMPEVGKGFLNMPTRTFMADVGLFGSGADSLATDGTWPSQGHVPEFAPLCYSPFLLDLATSHPHMMALFDKLFCGDRFCIDHATVLNRKQGEGPGRHWHGHRYGDGRYEEHDEDSDGSPDPKFLRRQCIRTLCYPEGAISAEEGGHGGELGLVPGVHLYRVPFEASFSHADDAEMEQWLQGKTHPRHGTPLRIKRLTVPPGSFISFCHHMPHWVGPRVADAPTRWAFLFANRAPLPHAAAEREAKAVAAEEASKKWGPVMPAQWLRRMDKAIARGEHPPWSKTARSILGPD